MQLTLLKGYPDEIGKRFAFVGFGNGPKPYVTGGDPVVLPGFQNYIDLLMSGGFAVSGTYYVDAIQVGVGARQVWKLIWTVSATDAEVANGVDLSAEKIQVGGFGGVY